MISNEDRVYYIDPVQAPLTGRTNVTQIVLLRTFREQDLAGRFGQVVTVTHQQIEQSELWWVDENRDYMYGAPIFTTPCGYGVPVLSLLEEGFIHGISDGAPLNSVGISLSRPRWSDGRTFPGPIDRYAASSVVMAAPWAADLLPEAGDTQAIVDAKVAIAKQKFVQREKKAAIYREGVVRDWLEMLGDVRDAGHDLPEPVFNLGTEGTAMVATGNTVTFDSLTDPQKARLQPVLGHRIKPQYSTGQATEYLSIPYRTVTALTSANSAGLRQFGANTVNYETRSALGLSSSVHVTESNRFAILSGF